MTLGRRVLRTPDALAEFVEAVLRPAPGERGFLANACHADRVERLRT